MSSWASGGWLRFAAIGAVVASFGLTRLMFNIVGARTQGLEVVGSANLALSWAMLIALPVSAGLAPMVTRFAAIATDASAADGVFRLGIRHGLVWISAPLLTASVLLAWQPFDSPVPAVLPMWGWAFGYACASLVRAWLFGRNQVRACLVLEGLAFASFLGAIGIGQARAFPSLPFSVYFAPAVLFMLFLAISKSRLSREEVRHPDHLRYAAHALLGSVVSLGIASGATLLAAVDGLGSAGTWALLMSLISPLLLAPRTLSTAMLPRLSRSAALDPAQFAVSRAIHRDLSAWIGLVVIVPLCFLGPQVLGLVLTESAAKSPNVTWLILLLAAWGTIRGEPLVTAVSARGRADACAQGSLATGALAIGAWWLLRDSGLQGLATAYALFTITTPFVITWIARLGPIRSVHVADLLVLGAFLSVPLVSEAPLATRSFLSAGPAVVGLLALFRLAPRLGHLFADS